MMDVPQKSNHPDFRSRLHAGTRRIPHQNRRGLDSGNLAGAAYHRHHHCSHHHSLPYLEAQA